MTEIRNRDGRDYLDVDRASAMIGGSGFLGVLAASPENVTYLSGFFHPDLRSLPERMHLVFWPAEGEPVFVVPSMRALHWLGLGEQSFIGPEDTRPLIDDVRPYDGEDLEMVRVLAEVLQEKGLTRGVLGVEMRNLPLKVAVELTRLVPGVRYEDAWPLFDAMRAVKSPINSVTLWPASTNCCNFRNTTACPMCRSALVGSSPSLTLRRLPPAMRAASSSKVST